MATQHRLHPLDRWTEDEQTIVLAGDTLRRGRPMREWDLWSVVGYLAVLAVGLWGLVNW